MPERLLAAAVGAVFDGGRLGVIVPIPHQRETAIARWSAVDPGVAVVVASPYQDAAHLIRAAEELRQAGVTLVVMECLGLTSVMKSVVRDVTGAPALLPVSLVARFFAELA
jgi:protein AroM